MKTIHLGKNIEIRRHRNGVPTINAPNRMEMMRGLGYMHVMDRGVQMEINRLMARGISSKELSSDEFFVRADTQIHRIGLHLNPAADLEVLSSKTIDLLKSYTDGINLAWQVKKRPLLFRAMRYKPQPWKLDDIVFILRAISYYGFTTLQIRLERSLLGMVRQGTGLHLLRELFGQDIEGLDPELLRSIKLLHDEREWGDYRISYAAGMVSGNAWAISGSHTPSRTPIIANDPHMDVGYLPNLWYEVELHTPDISVAGATAAGMPFVVSGRNRKLGWALTYAPGDTVDFYVEECRNGKRRVGDRWEPFKERVEELPIRGGEVRRFSVYTSPHGVLEGNPYSPGRYLSLLWTGQPGRFGATLESGLRMELAETVEEGLELASHVSAPPLAWILADADGHIGYRVSGAFPRRRAPWTGLYPVPGWDSRYDWQGFLESHELPWALDPEEGFVVAANQAQNPPDGPVIMNGPLANWRYRRIKEQLASKASWNVDQVQQLQYDLVSPLAQKLAPLFLKYVDPEEKEVHAELNRWQYSFNAEARQPVLFEAMLNSVLSVVFGDGGIGREHFDHLLKETTFLLTTSQRFAEILTNPTSLWFEGRDYDQCMRSAIQEALVQPIHTTWSEHHPLVHRHLYLGRLLPSFFRVNRGPFGVHGHHSTILQYTEFVESGIKLRIAPSYRMVSDLGSNEIWTNLAGGPSESPFSRFYANDLPNWRYGEYKRLRLRHRV